MRYQTALRPEERRTYTAQLRAVNSFLGNRESYSGQARHPGRKLFPMQPDIVLLTDFGHQDPYVGQMKGAILQHLPTATIIDLCHEIQPHAVAQAEFLLWASLKHFSLQSVFACVVDPGVGSARDLLIARQGERFFLGPNNGLLSFLDGASWWRVPDIARDVSRTFHGRDIIAPLAARLARGESPDAMGSPIPPGDLTPSSLTWVTVLPGELDCTVLHIDRFGNCLLNFRVQDHIPRGATWTLHTGETIVETETYADLPRNRIGLIAGSQGVLELAMNQQSCARALGLTPGDKVRMQAAGASA